MSSHYHDAGSGPHSAPARENGERNCGCRHDGLRWLSMCEAARQEWRARHDAATKEKVT